MNCVALQLTLKCSTKEHGLDGFLLSPLCLPAHGDPTLDESSDADSSPAVGVPAIQVLKPCFRSAFAKTSESQHHQPTELKTQG